LAVVSSRSFLGALDLLPGEGVGEALLAVD